MRRRRSVMRRFRISDGIHTADVRRMLARHGVLRVVSALTVVWLLAAWLLASDAMPQDAARRSPDAPSYTLQGQVVRVTDGDGFTLLVAGRHQRVRMASIDAPELAQPSRQRRGQPYARAARAALTELIAGKTLTLACFEPDSYGRHVCDVPLSDDPHGATHAATTANRRMVEQGMAWANRQQDRFLRDPALADLQRQARAQQRGLWRDRHPVAPWVWRDQCWRRGQCD